MPKTAVAPTQDQIYARKWFLRAVHAYHHAFDMGQAADYGSVEFEVSCFASSGAKRSALFDLERLGGMAAAW